MDHQLRTYTLKPGRMEDFLVLWREHVVPARAAHGFRVVGAWVNREEDLFTWVVQAEGDFAAADQAYYDGPERAALPWDPKDALARVETRMYAACS